MENNDSIIFRSGLIMGSIVLLALLSMISSVFIAESSKGDAAAINLAGSLRMQSYRIATRLQQQTRSTDTRTHMDVAREIDDFERRLADLRRTGAIPSTMGDHRTQMLKAIETFWRETLLPRLRASASGEPTTSYLREVDDFVARLDAFVKLLEQDNEAKILLLRLTQGIALFMMLVLIFAAMYQLHANVVVPLHDLVELARKARSGDLSVRASHVGHDELGVLGHAFNLMATDLSALYADLEARVEQQTQALRTSNRSLEILYHTARRLNETTPSGATYQTLIAEIEKLTGLGSIALCLLHPASHQAEQVFSSRPDFTAFPFCSHPDCTACVGDGSTHRLTGASGAFSIPVKDQERQFGVLMVLDPNLDSVAGWRLTLLETVAQQIAATLRATEQAEYHRRLELLEERNAIARELHDSLAQALSYLKIQITRLQVLLGGAENAGEACAVVAELREGLNSAYRQLRELIATFRLRMDHPRLEDSLRDVAQEIGRRGPLLIDLDCADWRCTLDPNEQIHVMQIVREALNNAMKHAQASHVRVKLQDLDHGEATISISDDGIGLPAHPEHHDYFGLNIMRERASQLNGTLTLQSSPAGGLAVELRFVPVARQRATVAGFDREPRYA